MGFWDGGGISWTTCKQSAPRSRQITTTVIFILSIPVIIVKKLNSLKHLVRTTVAELHN